LFSESTFPLSSAFVHHALLLDLAFKQAMARSGGMQCQELLTQSKILQKKVPARTQSTEDPAEEMPDKREHAPRSYRKSGHQTSFKSFILRVQEILMRDSDTASLTARLRPGILSLFHPRET
jgi:hypothetical protein